MTWPCRISLTRYIATSQMKDLSATASTSSSTKVRLWSTLHDLAMQDQSDEVYSNITDERLVSNGIQIQFYQGKSVKHTT